jgi:FG-GAP-like repeat
MIAQVWPISTVRASTLVLIFAALLVSSRLAFAQFAQQGSKLVGTGAVVPSDQGSSVALSADGNTAIVGGSGDNSGIGAAWVYTRSGDVWTQQGDKLVGSGAVGSANQGISVALSADGNTAIVGGSGDNSGIGAAWVYTRSGAVWTQQGSKLVGSGAVGNAGLGISVALSGDGNTAIVGGNGDNSGIGAAWVYTRSGGVWTQQGDKLVGTGAVGTFIEQGNSVALSADGNTAIVGGPQDNGDIDTVGSGAAWVFTRSGVVWTQQGSKLVSSGSSSGSPGLGYSVALSGDGNTAIVGGPYDGGTSTATTGAAWVYTRSSAVWTQQGSKLVGSGAVAYSLQGYSVALSADGNTAIVGGSGDDNSGIGAAWVFTRNGGVWTQQGSKLVGTGAVGNAFQGYSVALSGDGNTAIVGGPGDNSSTGAAWVFVQQPPMATNTHDYNGDGKSDILWRDTSGNVAIWEMIGTSVLNPTAAFVGNVSTVWKIVGTGDFNADGKSDILWRDTSGNVAIWEMNGTSVLNPTATFVGNVPTSWLIIGFGDFNGDGKSDVLWHDTSGNVAIWEMSGTSVLNPTATFVGNVQTSWSIVGTGDFNGDGNSDVLWRDTSGNVAIWEMNGTSVLNPAATFVGNVSTVWTIVGTGDFNGDGKSDLLWRDTSGNVAIWEMNGTSVLNPAATFVGNVSTVWTIVGTGDFNGDGKSDILWRDTSGNVAIWEMNGTSVLNPTATFVGNVPTVWTIED